LGASTGVSCERLPEQIISSVGENCVTYLYACAIDLAVRRTRRETEKALVNQGIYLRQENLSTVWRGLKVLALLQSLT
jgi:hypothetical protein